MAERRVIMSEVALTIPFSLDPLTGSLIVTSDQNLIWSNRVRGAIETAVGERVMRPTYGTKIANEVFNTTGSFEATLQREASRVFTDQLPLLKLVSVTSSLQESSNTLFIEVTYQLPNNVLITTKAGVMVVSSSNPPYQELTI